MNKIKSHMNDTLSDIIISSELKENILNSTVNKPSKNHHFSAKRAVCLLAAIILIFSTVTTAFASVNPTANNIVYSVNPQLAQFLYPINKTCEKQGIRLTVLEAINDDRNIIAYFTLEDTEGKGRVNERLDLCDSYGVDGPTVYNVSFESYDEKTGKALYCMTANGSKKMSGKMNSFKINTLMSNKKIYNYFNTDFDLSIVKTNPQTAPMSDYESYSNNVFDTILLPDTMDIAITDFVSVSNIGFIDGRLHIQTKWKKSFDNHGWFALSEKGKSFSEENTVSYEMQYIHTEEDKKASGNNYFVKHIEYAFDISPEDLEKYELWANLTEDGEFIEDKWKVDFRLAKSDRLELIDNLENIAEKVEISNIGLYIEKYQGNPEDCTVSVKMKDNSVFNISTFTNNESENYSNTEWSLSTVLGSYIDINEISSVTMNGKIIYEQ